MSKFYDNNILVIDIEATCWEDKNKPKDEINEIIEIGICVVDFLNLKILSSESILVKPQKSKISKYCTDLTTITQDMVNSGVTLSKACNLLQSKYISYRRPWLSWGEYDKNIFEKNCKEYNIKYPFGQKYINLKNLFSVMHGLGGELGMSKAINYLGKPLLGTHHRGVDDAINIAEIFIDTVKKFRTGN